MRIIVYKEKKVTENKLLIKNKCLIPTYSHRSLKESIIKLDVFIDNH